MKIPGNNISDVLKARILPADIRMPAVLLSLLVSAWVAYTTDMVNGDAVLYLSAANLVDAGNWSDACQLSALNCWLLYPSLIALVGNITGLGMENAAYVLNALFSALMVIAFLSLVRELGADRRTLLVAAFVILFHPYINENKADILRDHGYWAFYLVMVFFFIRYWQRLDWKNALAWGLSAIVATLFRIEGIVFLLLLPVVLLFQPGKQLRWRAASLLKAYTVPALLMSGLLGWWLFGPGFSPESSGRLFDPLQRLVSAWEQISTGMDSRAQVIREQVLGNYIDDYALPALWITLGLVVVSKIVNTLTPLYAVLPFIRKLHTHFAPPAGVVAVLGWLIMLNLAILLVEIISEFILSGRFVVPLALTVMLMVPFTLVAVYDLWLTRSTLSWRVRWVFPVIIAALLFMTVDGIYSTGKGDKTYLRQAGFWLRDRLASGETVYADELRLFYYTGQEVDWHDLPRRGKTVALLKSGAWRQYDHVAINTEREDDVLLGKAAGIMGVADREFRNDRRAGVLIFTNKQSDNEMEAGAGSTP